MICTADRCRSGLRECKRTECGYADETESAARVFRAMNAPIRRIEFAGDEPEEFTQSEMLDTLTFCEPALYFAIGAAAVAAVLFLAVQVWPLIAVALN